MKDWNPFTRFPKASFGGLAVLLFPLFWGLKDLRIRSDTDVLLESNPSQKAALDKVVSVFQERTIVVVDLECPDVFTAQGLSAIGRVSDALMTVEGVQDVKSLTHSYKPVRKGLSFQMEPLASGGESPADWERLREYCLGNPLIRNVMVSPDCRHATLTLTFKKPFPDLNSKRELRANLEAVLAQFETEGLAFEMIGLPLVEEEVHTRIMEDLVHFTPMVFLFLAAVLGLVFRSIGFVLFLMGNQAVALGWIAGSLQWIGYPFTVFTLLLFPLWAGVHLTLLVHLGAACQRAAKRCAGREVVPTALREIGKSCCFAVLTTLAGLLSLGLAEISQVREAGLVGAYGIVVVFLMTFGPGVGIMSLFFTVSASAKRRRNRPSTFMFLGKTEPPKPDAADNLPGRWLKGLRRWNGAVWLLVGLLVFGIILLAPRLRMGVRPLEFLPKDSLTRSAGELFNECYGGFNIFQMRLDSGRAGGVNQLPFLRYLDKVQKYAAAKPQVSGAYSYPQVLAMMNQIWEQEQPGSLRLPDNPLLLGMFSLVLKSQQFPFFEALCDADFQTANLVVRTPDLPSNEYLAVVKDIIRYAETNRPAGVQWNAAQGLHSILEADRQIVGSQIKSASTALLAVFGLLSLLWRSWKLASLAVLLNALPVALVIALAALLDIPLNSITVMTAALAFGIAVDDTVHFVTQWLEARRNGINQWEATSRAIRIKARPIVCTSLVLGGIFALLAATSFPPVKHFGSLTACAFALALISVFVLLPLCLCFSARKPIDLPQPLR